MGNICTLSIPGKSRKLCKHSLPSHPHLKDRTTQFLPKAKHQAFSAGDCTLAALRWHCLQRQHDHFQPHAPDPPASVARISKPRSRQNTSPEINSLQVWHHAKTIKSTKQTQPDHTRVAVPAYTTVQSLFPSYATPAVQSSSMGGRLRTQPQGAQHWMHT